MHILLQIRCRGHILGDSCLVIFGSQYVGNFSAAGNIGVVWEELVAGNNGVVQEELAIALRYLSHYMVQIVVVLVVARHSALVVADGSPH